jgi:hypothetical protein
LRRLAVRTDSPEWLTVRQTPGNRVVAVVQGHANGIVIEYEIPLAREGADWKVDR